MEYRQLGAGGPEIPVIMFGAWPIGGGMGPVEADTAIDTVRRAVELGVSAIDTAEFYRGSEATLGNALEPFPRERLFIASKVSSEPFTRARIQEAVESSLRALKTDYLDLYQLHRYPTGVSLEEAMEGLAELHRSGKARYVGVSNFSTEQLEAARATYPIQSLQPRLNIFDREATTDLLPYCHGHGIGAIVHSSLAKGLLTGKYRPGHTFALDDERSRFPRFQGETFARYLDAADRLAEVARERDVTLVQLAIAWTLAQEGVTSCIVGAKSPEQVDEQVRASGLALSPEELRHIEEIAASV